MTAGRGAVILAASVLVGATVPWPEALGSFLPDLPIVAVLLIAARAGALQALVLAAFAGIAVDALTTSPAGVHALALTLLSYAVCWLRDRIDVEALPLRALLLLAAPAVTETLVRVVLSCITRLPLEPSGEGWLGRGLATLVLGLLVWRAPRPSAAPQRA